MVLQPILWAPKTWVLKGFCWVPQFVNICTSLGVVLIVEHCSGEDWGP